MARSIHLFMRLRPIVSSAQVAEQVGAFQKQYVGISGLARQQAPGLQPASVACCDVLKVHACVTKNAPCESLISRHIQGHITASWANVEKAVDGKRAAQSLGTTVGGYGNSHAGDLLYTTGARVSSTALDLSPVWVGGAGHRKSVSPANIVTRFFPEERCGPGFSVRWMSSEAPRSTPVSTPVTPMLPASIPLQTKPPKYLYPESRTVLARLQKLSYGLPGHVSFFGHAASLFGLLALFQKDILWLRTFLVCGSLCGIAFNLLQPHPLKIPAAYGGIFILLNLTMIALLLNERRPVDFEQEELELYELVFQKHGVTPHQFERLLQSRGFKWLDIPAGHVLLKEGEEVNFIYVVVKGGAKVSKTAETCGQIQRGSLVGETALLVKGHKAGHTVITTQPSRVAVWPKHELRRLLADDPSLLLSTSKVINSDLAAKLAHSNVIVNQAHAFLTYKEVLKGICADEVITPHEKRALREYRMRHNITAAQHNEALAHCEWTVEEYEDGAKRDSSWMHFSIKNSISSFNRGIAQMVESASGGRKPKQAESDGPTPSPTALNTSTGKDGDAADNTDRRSVSL